MEKFLLLSAIVVGSLFLLALVAALGGAKMADTIETLRLEYANLLTESETFGSKETPTAEEKTADENRFKRMDVIKEKLDRHTKLAEHAFASGKATKVIEPPGKEEAVRIEMADAKNIDRQEFGRAMTKWAVDGVIENKYATITTATQSGLFLPKAVMAPLTPVAANAFREGYAAWGLPVMDTMGDTSTFNLPVVDAVAGGLVAENASSETDGTPTLTDSIVSTVKTYQSGSVYYSGLQLSATKFDLLAATIPTLDFAKELGLETAIAAAMVADSGITQSVLTATVAGFTYANFASFNNKLPKRYQSLKIMLLSADAFAAADGLVDSQGRPILNPDAQNQNVRRIGNTPTFRCDFLQAFGANNVVGLIISLVGFHLRDAGIGITRYTQVPAKPNQIGINEFGYHAYGYAPHAVAKFVCPAS